ncbi:MAG: hypothetical protein GKS01_08150 [Alphaproteobacteria bacterium]|nr:hypothetical protein [Alphaproteobacteria bacterium]
MTWATAPQAQTGQLSALAPATEKSSPNAAPVVTKGTVSATQLNAAIPRYLSVGNPGPGDVVQRAVSLMRSLRDQKKALKPAELFQVVSRVSTLATKALTKTSITRLAVASDYKPRNAMIALDFGPADGKVMDGFTRVVPGDQRVAGESVSALRRPEDSALLADGLAGIKTISIDVPVGSYRIVLMTQDLGDPRYSAPLGRQIRINKIPFLVTSGAPDQWTRDALLSGASDSFDKSGLRVAGGYLSGDLSKILRRQQLRQVGGAIIIEGQSNDGKLVIELIGFKRETTYLTGLIVEPLNQVSDVVLSRPAFKKHVSLRSRLSLEAKVLSAAAEAVEGIEPEAGQTLEEDKSATTN